MVRRAKKSAAKKPASSHGTFIWNELMTRDDKRALDFFRNVLGWTHEDWPMADGGTYRILKMKGHERGVGGIMKMTAPAFPPQVPAHWCSYVGVDDVDKRAALAKKHGGQIVHGPEDIPGIGRFCILKDPTGAVMAFMTPKPGAM